jgi:hypothetical protein
MSTKFDAIVSLGQAVTESLGVVRRAIIDDQHSHLDVGLGEYASYAPLQQVAIVVTRDDHADGRSRAHRRRARLAVGTDCAWLDGH